MMRKTSVFLLLLVIAAQLTAQKAKRQYKETSEPIINPERGFYAPSGTKASKFEGLQVAQLKKYRDEPQQMNRASYKIKFSLIYRGYELDIFKDKPLSEEFLSELEKDLMAVRDAGLKMIIRFAYTNSTKSGDCPDEYKICPPYGDAPPEIVLKHIEQLKPVLRRHSDVIAVMQEGFIGIWGENYFTDYFGDASMNGDGKILDAGWILRNKVLKALLDAMPKNRMIQVRTPQIKQKFVYGPSAPLSSAPLAKSDAFNESDNSRVGFHNDCFLASDDDYGTFYDYGSSTQQRQPAKDILRKYIMDDTKYTAVGGETCDDAFSPQNDCAPGGYAEEEMRRMHYSYLNAAYNVDVINDWDSAGCFTRVFNNLGYRFVLKNIAVPAVVKSRQSFDIQFTIENKGYASMYNKRPVKLVLRNKSGEYFVDLPVNPQHLFTGTHNIKRSIVLPGNIKPGSYQLFLFMPDADEQLAKRSEYSVQLANENMWEERTGYNNLALRLEVK